MEIDEKLHKKLIASVGGAAMWEVIAHAFVATCSEQGNDKPTDRVPAWNGFLMAFAKSMREDLGDKEAEAALARALVGMPGINIEDIHVEKRRAHSPSGTKH